MEIIDSTFVIFSNSRKEQSKCLLNPASKVKREDVELYRDPGIIYDADAQCIFMYGSDAKSCPSHNAILVSNITVIIEMY